MLKTLPPPLPDITQETSLKILGVTFSNNLSASDHIRNVVRMACPFCHCLIEDMMMMMGEGIGQSEIEELVQE